MPRSSSPVINRSRKIRGSGDDHETIRSNATERVRLPAELATRIASITGVDAVVPERSFPASLVVAGNTQLTGPAGGPSLGHSWASAAITPFTLTSGRSPMQDHEIVVDAGLAERAGIVVGSTARVVAAGVPWTPRWSGSPLRNPARRSGSSPRSSSPTRTAERLYGHVGEVDLFGVHLAAGADRSGCGRRRPRRHSVTRSRCSRATSVVAPSSSTRPSRTFD